MAQDRRTLLATQKLEDNGFARNGSRCVMAVGFYVWPQKLEKNER